MRAITGLNPEQAAEYDRIRAAGDVPALMEGGKIVNLSAAQRVTLRKTNAVGPSTLFPPIVSID